MDSESVEVKPPKNKGGRPKGPSRAQLAAKLNEALQAIDQLKAAVAVKPEADTAMARRLREAEADLEALRPGASGTLTPLRGPAPQYVPYKGLVRAKIDCVYGCLHFGPKYGLDKKGQSILTDPAEIFEVDVPVLWSDDPYEPVKRVGEEHAPRYEVDTSIPVIDARWRMARMGFSQAADPIARAV